MRSEQHSSYSHGKYHSGGYVNKEGGDSTTSWLSFRDQCQTPWLGYWMGGSGPLCISPSIHLGKSGGEVTGLPMQQNHSDSSRVAKHILVLRFGDHVQSNRTELARPAHPADPTIQSDSSQVSVKSKSACMGTRASAIKEQGFFEAAVARIEAPKRGSVRSVYEERWTIFTK